MKSLFHFFATFRRHFVPKAGFGVPSRLPKIDKKSTCGRKGNLGEHLQECFFIDLGCRRCFALCFRPKNCVLRKFSCNFLGNKVSPKKQACFFSVQVVNIKNHRFSQEKQRFSRNYIFLLRRFSVKTYAQNMKNSVLN